MESFRIFQKRILDEYEAMIDEFGLTVMDGTLPIEEQQEQMRAIVRDLLKDYKGLDRAHREAVAR